MILPSRGQQAPNQQDHPELRPRYHKDSPEKQSAHHQNSPSPEVLNFNPVKFQEFKLGNPFCLEKKGRDLEVKQDVQGSAKKDHHA